MNKPLTAFVVLGLALASLACGGGQPQTVEVEVTRIVPQTVEVTRVVPQTVEVTRAVRVIVTATPRPPTPTPRPTNTPPAPKVGSRSNPVSFGQEMGLVMDKTKQFEVAVTEAYRGNEAWSRIRAANRFNEPPSDGMEYILLYAEVNYLKGPDDEALKLAQWDFRVVSKGQVLDPPSVVEPKPEFEIAFFPGASGGGWMTWAVYADDPDPMLVIGMDYEGAGGFYFATHP